jgi:ADP-dependent NAD(P)H-hydrate dehydratase / NAD(P)H-hydrate epimerase
MEKINIKKEFKGLLKRRIRDTYKGDYGHVFVLAGSRGLTGAAALCANAALRSGAGLVTLGIPFSLNIAMEVKLTEVMTYPLPETKTGALSLKAKKDILAGVRKSDVVVMGPGLSSCPETWKLIRQLIISMDKKMVLDADALNAAAENPAVLKKIRRECVLTPHYGEFSGIIKKDADYIKKNKIIVAKKFLEQYNAILVLKGSETLVSERIKHSVIPSGFRGNDNLYCFYKNTTGNPGMATAGSGDVLTGIIAGFLSQGLSAFDAAKLGVYVHGLAGDLAAAEKGEVSLIAGDILEKLPEAVKLTTEQV